MMLRARPSSFCPIRLKRRPCGASDTMPLRRDSIRSIASITARSSSSVMVIDTRFCCDISLAPEKFRIDGSAAGRANATEESSWCTPGSPCVDKTQRLDICDMVWPVGNMVEDVGDVLEDIRDMVEDVRDVLKGILDTLENLADVVGDVAYVLDGISDALEDIEDIEDIVEDVRVVLDCIGNMLDDVGFRRRWGCPGESSGLSSAITRRTSRVHFAARSDLSITLSQLDK